MNQRADDALIEKLQQLPPEQIAAVADFIDFLRMKNEARALTRAATRTAEPAFAALWDNADDAEYDRL